MQCFCPNATPGSASTTRAGYLTHFRWKVVRRSNYPVHAALPSKHYARQGIYYPHRIHYPLLPEGSPEVELPRPGSACVQTLRLAGHVLSTYGTLLLLMKGHTEANYSLPTGICSQDGSFTVREAWVSFILRNSTIMNETRYTK